MGTSSVAADGAVDDTSARKQLKLGRRLAVFALCVHTCTALAASLASFNCRPCSMLLLVSAFVIVPLQAVAWILSCIGIGLRLPISATAGAAVACPCGWCCCKSTEAVLTSSTILNLVAICFLCGGVALTLGLRTLYGHDAVAVTLAVVQVVVMGLLALVSKMNWELSPWLRKKRSASSAV